MGQTADDIRQELDRKRHELSHDVERIEEKVRSTFDVNRYIEEQPLVATGVAVLAGFLLGNMVGGGGGSNKSRSQDYSGYYGGYGAYGGYAPQSGYYGGGSGYQPSHQQSHQGNGMMASVKDSVKQGFQSTAGNRDIENTMSSVTAALTAILVEKARQALDQNLPGFSEKFEQAQQQRGSQDPAMSTTYSAGAGDLVDRSAGSYGGSTGGAHSDSTDSSSFGGTSGDSGRASGSEHLGPSSSRSM